MRRKVKGKEELIHKIKLYHKRVLESLVMLKVVKEQVRGL